MNNEICKSLAKKQIITKIINFFETSENKAIHKNFDDYAVYKYEYITNEQYDPRDINIGDYIQSLAAKQYLPTKKTILIDRDSTKYYNGTPVNLIANGWYAVCNGNEVFSDKINPLFVSVHINNLNDITQKTLEYLKKHEPIGCRDYTTRNFLILQGVKAYFSGCLTTTLDKKYKAPENEKTDNIIFCDYKINEEKPSEIDKKLKKILKNYNTENIEYTHHCYDFGLTAEECFKTAEELLNKYARAKLVITTRIHCALPCLALGTPVILVIPSKYDKLRYDGLTQLLNVIGYDRHKMLISKLTRNSNGEIINNTKYLKYANQLKITAENFVNNMSENSVIENPEKNMSDLDFDYNYLLCSNSTQNPCYEPIPVGGRRALMFQPGFPIIFAINDSAAAAAAAAIYSIYKNSKEKHNLKFYILFSELSPKNLSLLKKFAKELDISLELVDINNYINENIDKYLSADATYNHITKETYFRFYIPELFRQFEKVLYLDSDIIVLHDIAELFNTDISKYYAGVVKDINMKCICEIPTRCRPSINYETYLRTKLNMSYDNYFNAGILLLNLKRINNDNIQQKLWNFLRANFPLDFQDQDVLNAVFNDNVKYLDFKWNIPIDLLSHIKSKKLKEQKELFKIYYKNPYILHYCGKSKPWSPSGQPKYKYKNILIWWKYYKNTPFFNPGKDILPFILILSEYIIRYCKNKILHKI